MTELLYLAQQELRTFDATVTNVEANEAGSGAKVELDCTAFYPTGGGQPHDSGTLSWPGGSAAVTEVKKQGTDVWHTLVGDIPEVGNTASAEIDWDRRHDLMRTHTAMHILCGVIWNEYQVAVTGGNMEPLKARMDFAFDPLPEGFAATIEAAVNAEIEANREIEVSFLPRDTALVDEDLIRTKVNMIPESVTEIRVVDIVGLDKQADGGTHVRTTAEVGRFTVTKTESKGKGNKRLRFELS